MHPLHRRLAPLLLIAMTSCTESSPRSFSPDRWQDHVGARSTPRFPLTLSANDFGAVPLPASAAGVEPSSTRAIQQAIDAASAKGGGTVTLAPGTYITGSLFLKSNVFLRIDPGVTLLGSLRDEDFPIIHTRAGGIELDWPAALLNIRDATNARIGGAGGGGIVDARGAHWWKKFFDALPDYERRGIRWAVDYDTGRPHLLQVYNSSDITIDNLQLIESPFWTIDVVYSHHITVDHITVRNNRPGQPPPLDKGPSTDGINVDSSRFVLVQNCDVDCNDDCYCFKSGMNADGLRVNRPCEYVLFRHNIARRGDGGITVGSDMSGGVRHVEAADFTCIGTKEGLRMKSARVRGGTVEDVTFRRFTLTDVPTAISFNLNWFPAFSYPTLPDPSTGIPIKPHWRIMAQPVPPDKAIPTFRNITLSDITATGSKTAISVEGLPEKPLENITLTNIHIQSQTAGTIQNARNWQIQNLTLTTQDHTTPRLVNTQNITLP